MTDDELMDRAVALAREGMARGAGGPFGAVVARDGVPVGEGWNCVTSGRDPTAHGEVVAIRAACAALGTHSLAGCVLFTSCEPCPMCVGAIGWARLDRVWFGADRWDAAAAGFDDAVQYAEVAKAPEERRVPMRRLARAGAVEVFAAWGGKADRVAY